MRIRGYQRGDVEAMHRLDLICFEVPFQFDHATMREAAETTNAIVIVVTDRSSGMLGFLIVHPEGPAHDASGYIVTIDVAPSARGTGVGAAMLIEAEAQARVAGVKRMGLHVSVSNKVAIEFYERQHYGRVSKEKNFYRQARQDAFVYSKEL